MSDNVEPITLAFAIELAWLQTFFLEFRGERGGSMGKIGGIGADFEVVGVLVEEFNG